MVNIRALFQQKNTMHRSLTLTSLAVATLLFTSACQDKGDDTATTPTPIATATVTLNLLNEEGIGEKVGTVEAQDTEDGLLLVPNLSNLTPGEHGFHVHTNPDCGPGEKDGKIVPGLAAGGHYDPENTGKHEGPEGDGHLGDLPRLIVAQDGTATEPVLAPRLTVEDIQGRSLMVHAGGDNFSDEPKPLGGGGARLACGVIK